MWKGMAMKAAILTMFNGLSKTYSLVSVVEEQIRMLLHADISVKVLVSQDCPDHERYDVYNDPRVEWIKITNRYQGEWIHWRDYSNGSGKVHDTFDEEAAVIAEDLVHHLANTDVCLMHDILYQGWHLVHNVAVRQAQAELPHLRFISFTHSAPVPRPAKLEWPFSARFLPMPNTLFVYPTASGLPALARQYHVPIHLCHAVSNSLDPFLGMHEAVLTLNDHMDLLGKDILIIYPARLTPAKQCEKVAALAGALYTVSGLTTAVIFCDFPSMDIDAAVYKKKIAHEAQQHGLKQSDILFTSDCGWKTGFPHQAVMDLFVLSNCFICPSYSESFGLTVLEAASRGNFLVLNQAVPALHELGDALGAYFMRWGARNFGYDTKETYHPSKKEYLHDHAGRIATAIKENTVLQAKTISRQRYHPKAIWHRQLEPLLNS